MISVFGTESYTFWSFASGSFREIELQIRSFTLGKEKLLVRVSYESVGILMIITVNGTAGISERMSEGCKTMDAI